MHGRRWPKPRQGEFLGSARMMLHPDGVFATPMLTDGYTVRSLDATQPDDFALLERLVARTDEDDLDEAEIDIDNLDQLIEVVLDPSGEIASFASSHDFDMAPGYGDIGVMTRPDCRGLGLGRAAVVAVCNRMRRDGAEPLYRCDEDNVGSIALSAGLGFGIATQLIAFRFTSEA